MASLGRSRIRAGSRSTSAIPRIAPTAARAATRSRATEPVQEEPNPAPESQEVPIPPQNNGAQQSTEPEPRLTEEFHTAVEDHRLQVLELGERVFSTETAVRTLHSEVLTLQAQPRVSDITQDVRQLRMDYNAEREANSALKRLVHAQEVQIRSLDEALQLFRARLERLEDAQQGQEAIPVPLQAQPIEPKQGTLDKVTHPTVPILRLPQEDHSHHSAKRSRRSRHSKRRNLSSSESSSDTDSESQSSSDEERKKRKSKRHGPSGRVKGKRHGDLRELKPTNSLYKELLSYRYYRLNKTSHRRTKKETGKVSNHIKRMEISLKEHTFDGSDPIRILDFLTRFVNEANVLDMSEGQAYLALPKFLRGFAQQQYEAVNQSASADEGGVTCWPEAVQYFLRSYATGTAIQEATSALRAIRQRSGETETEFSTRLNIAEHRCGNVHSIEDRMTNFVDGLDPAIKTLVARHRESNRRITYLELIQFARAEGDAHRARSGTVRKPTSILANPKSPVRKDSQRHAALLVDSSESSSLPSARRGDATGEHLLLMDHTNEYSVPTTDLPSTMSPTEASEQSDPALLAGYRYVNRVPAPRIPYQEHNRALMQTRPGWQQQRARSPTPTAVPKPVSSGLICHSCYVREDHISPDCRLPWREFNTVVRNYEALSEYERTLVPIASYLRAKGQCPTEAYRAPAGNRSPRRPPSNTQEVHPRVLTRANASSQLPNHASKN